MNSYRLAMALALATCIGGCTQMSGDRSQTISLEAHAEETLRLKRKIADLETRLEASRQARAELEQENAELSKRIEMLKVLDQAVEEKRKNYNNQ